MCEGGMYLINILVVVLNGSYVRERWESDLSLSNSEVCFSFVLGLASCASSTHRGRGCLILQTQEPQSPDDHLIEAIRMYPCSHQESELFPPTNVTWWSSWSQDNEPAFRKLLHFLFLVDNTDIACSIGVLDDLVSSDAFQVVVGDLIDYERKPALAQSLLNFPGHISLSPQQKIWLMVS